MLDTGALSPEVKKLFSDIARQSEEYKRVFLRIDTAVTSFETERTDMKNQLDQIRNDISISIKKLESYAVRSVNEFKERTDKTYQLFLELDKIDQIKTDLFDLRDEIKVQTIDLSNSLVDFNSKSDKILESTISNIKTKLNNTVDEEVGKIEQRVIRRLAAFEQNQKVFERRILSIDTNLRADIKKMTGEIDYVYNSITEIKSDLSNYLKQIVESISHYDKEIPRMAKLLDNTVARMNDKGGKFALTADKTPEQLKEEEEFLAYNPDPANYDDAAFDFDNTTFGAKEDDPDRPLTDRELMDKIREEFENYEHEMTSSKGKNLLAIILSLIAIIGCIVVMVINAMG